MGFAAANPVSSKKRSDVITNTFIILFALFKRLTELGLPPPPFGGLSLGRFFDIYHSLPLIFCNLMNLFSIAVIIVVVLLINILSLVASFIFRFILNLFEFSF